MFLSDLNCLVWAAQFVWQGGHAQMSTGKHLKSNGRAGLSMRGIIIIAYKPVYAARSTLLLLAGIDHWAHGSP